MTAAFLAGVAALAGDEGVRIEVGARASWEIPQGSLRFDERPERGDRLEVGSDLDAERARLGGRMEIAGGRGGTRVGAFLAAHRFEGRAALDRPRRFNETLFGAGEGVETRLGIEEVGLSWEEDLSAPPGVRLWGGVGVRYWRIEALLASAAHGRDADHMGTAAPELRAGGEIRAGWGGRIRAAFFGTYVRIGGRTVEAFGAEGAVGLQGGASWSLEAGYRHEEWELVNRDRIQRNRLGLGVGGPWVGVEVRF